MLGRIPNSSPYPIRSVALTPVTESSVGPADTNPTVPSSLLRRWNLGMAFFHAIFMVTTLAIGNLHLKVDVYTTKTDVMYRVKGETTWREERPDGAEVDWRLKPTLSNTDELYLTYATAGFFLISATFHLLNATLWRGFYERQLADCRSPTRWAEYLFSAPLMFVLIAYGLGLRTRTELLTTAALVSATIPYGAWGECEARPDGPKKWSRPLYLRALPWVLGHVPQTVAWYVVIERFQGMASNAPAFVTVILWGEFFLFYSFGGAVLIGLFLPPSSFWKQEVAFQVLSLVSKGLLGILLLANVLMLENFDDAFEN